MDCIIKPFASIRIKPKMMMVFLCRQIVTCKVYGSNVVPDGNVVQILNELKSDRL